MEWRSDPSGKKNGVGMFLIGSARVISDPSFIAHRKPHLKQERHSVSRLLAQWA
jgi:hypothetical protein